MVCELVILKRIRTAVNFALPCIWTGADSGASLLQASDSVGIVTRDPPYHKETERQYFGTIVTDKADSSNLFVLEL